jgi:hypothetical protein
MEVSQKTRVRIVGALLMLFSVVFVSVPLMMGGHPGETVANLQQLLPLT